MGVAFRIGLARIIQDRKQELYLRRRTLFEQATRMQASILENKIARAAESAEQNQRDKLGHHYEKALRGRYQSEFEAATADFGEGVTLGGDERADLLERVFHLIPPPPNLDQDTTGVIQDRLRTSLDSWATGRKASFSGTGTGTSADSDDRPADRSVMGTVGVTEKGEFGPRNEGARKLIRNLDDGAELMQTGFGLYLETLQGITPLDDMQADVVMRPNRPFKAEDITAETRTGGPARDLYDKALTVSGTVFALSTIADSAFGGNERDAKELEGAFRKTWQRVSAYGDEGWWYQVTDDNGRKRPAYDPKLKDIEGNPLPNPNASGLYSFMRGIVTGNPELKKGVAADAVVSGMGVKELEVLNRGMARLDVAWATTDALFRSGGNYGMFIDQLKANFSGEGAPVDDDPTAPIGGRGTMPRNAIFAE